MMNYIEKCIRFTFNKEEHANNDQLLNPSFHMRNFRYKLIKSGGTFSYEKIRSQNYMYQVLLIRDWLIVPLFVSPIM